MTSLPLVAAQLCIFVSLTTAGAAAEQIILTNPVPPRAGMTSLEWHAQARRPISATYTEYRIEASSNLMIWQPWGEPLAGDVGVREEAVRQAVPISGNQTFYRIAAEQRMAPPGNFGDAVYGYATEFNHQMRALGRLSLAAFTNRYRITNEYLAGLSFDPTTARFWDAFNLDPAVHNATNSADPRRTDFRLNPQELAFFRTNGFVVSQRLGSHSFADAFYKIYSDDLPVFISADALMHAWHRSFVDMLLEIEETVLSHQLTAVLSNMQAALPGLYAESLANPRLTDGVLDAEAFLQVANGLSSDQFWPPPLSEDNTRFEEISGAYSAIWSLRPATIRFFGADRRIDFSLFTVRGHYSVSQRLQRYFRTLTWCGLMDFQFTGLTNDNSIRELAGAIAMNLLLDRSGMRASWQEMSRVVRGHFGLEDAMDFSQLGDLLAAAAINSPSDLQTPATFQELHARIMSGQLGVQNIRSGYLPSPLGPEQLTLPRSFAFLPQRLVLDSWALSKVVFDDIIWDEDGVPGFDDKVPRRVPSALDVAFAVFGNDHIVPDVAARIATTNGHPWRDGWPYQHNLAAVRNCIDRQSDAYWTNSIYGSWLACLRALSAPATGPEGPEVTRTRAWSMRSLNTQLASWTQLRHDTVLYAKQSFTAPVLCGYPAVFVEPYPLFWQKFREMAERTRALLATLPTNGTALVEEMPDFEGGVRSVDFSLERLSTNRLSVIGRFVDIATSLQNISEKQANRTALTSNDMASLKDVVEQRASYATGARTHSGWYPRLFYKNYRGPISEFGKFEGSDMWDPLVTDVHTDTPDMVRGDPGSILHQGVGNVHMAMIAVDCGGINATVFAGPILSHYEFELGPVKRLTDAEWKSQLKASQAPPHPEWTRGFLVPGPFTLPLGL